MVEDAERNLAIMDSFSKAESVVAKYRPEEIAVSISGGSDSDIMMDLMLRQEGGRRFHYVFFDTGMELAATKRHLDYLEDRYGINIERIRGFQSVPQAVRAYGQPFLSKYVSENIDLLQRRGFTWEDAPYEELIEKYTNCSSALKWWTNQRCVMEKYTYTKFNINAFKWLKEFMMANPPTFKVSKNCCTYAKKKTGHIYNKANGIKLSVVGVRKAEGGIRSVGKACFTSGNKNNIDVYRPLFWYREADKRIYEKAYDIKHSDCYSVYGFKRTGCTGCPFNPRVIDEGEVLREHEPLLYRACNVVFKESYEYTLKYQAFKSDMEARKKGEVSLWQGI